MTYLFRSVHLYLVYLLALACSVASETITWIPDNITYVEALSAGQGNSSWNYTVSIHSNGPLFEDIIGNFRLKFDVGYGSSQWIHGVTECIGAQSSADDAFDIVRSTILGEYPLVVGDDTPLSTFLDVRINKLRDTYNTTNKELNVFSLAVTSVKRISSLNISYLHHNCSITRTKGYWDDHLRWNKGRVPSTNDSVIIPSSVGVIILSQNISIRDFSMHGGTLQAYYSTCPAGWTTDDRSFST